MKEKGGLGEIIYPNDRRKHGAGINKTILVVMIILIIIPTILCILLFLKVDTLQKQVDMLMIDKYGITYAQMYHNHKNVVHAATTEDVWNQMDNDDIDKKDTTMDSINDRNVNRENNTGIDNKNIDNKNNENIIDADKNENDSDIDKKDYNKDDIGVDGDITEPNEDGNNPKKVYLTFDDGPSKNTEKVLDILKEYDVKATFFVIGKTDKHSKQMYQRIVKEGHALGLHSYSHKYKEIYESLDNFKYDLNKLRDLVFETTGLLSTIYRFPGGSGNQVSDLDISVFVDFLNENSITYFDWNVVNGDGNGGKLTPKESYENVIQGIKLHNKSIVLMHDSSTKESTVESLPLILETLIEEKVDILPLSDEVKPIQQVPVNN